MKLEQCHLCDKVLPVSEMADDYEQIHYVCSDCFKNRKEEWEKIVEHYQWVDYGHSEWD